jgi:hypothetical protein
MGHASEMLIRELKVSGRLAEILKPGFALGAGAIGVDQAADRGEAARPCTW